MRRADRLFRIVEHLRDGRLVTAQKLGEWLDVSERTIYRDIADLQSTGVPIAGEAGVGYLMRQAVASRRGRPGREPANASGDNLMSRA
jgi:predicted DNA-binding transcriptional regulator YafY